MKNISSFLFIKVLGKFASSYPSFLHSTIWQSFTAVQECFQFPVETNKSTYNTTANNYKIKSVHMKQNTCDSQPPESAANRGTCHSKPLFKTSTWDDLLNV